MVTADNLTTVFNGLSTDTKPTEARNGDKFRELDTGTTYIFDEDGGEWFEMAVTGGGSGGGGSSSGGGVLYGNVTLQIGGGGERSAKSEAKGETREDEDIYEVDLSFNDIMEAIEDGKTVIFKTVSTEENVELNYNETITYLEPVVYINYNEELDGSNPEYMVSAYSFFGQREQNFYSTSASEHMTSQAPEEPDDGGGGDHPID